MKTKMGQKDEYSLENYGQIPNEKPGQNGNYLLSTISQRMSPMNAVHISPMEAEMSELMKSQTRLSRLVCILASALILSSLISAVFIVLFLLGMVTAMDGNASEPSQPPQPFFFPFPSSEETNGTATAVHPIPFDEDYPYPNSPLPQNEIAAAQGRKQARTGSTEADLRYNKLAALSNQDYLNQVLQTIAIPRPVNSQNHAFIQTVITTAMEAADWTVTKDTFSQWVAYRGTKTFTNIIATLNPLAPYKLVLACHYDSKQTNFNFVAATDSAAPCSILLNMAKFLTPVMKLEPSKMLNTTVQMIFFDGEEAFNRWSATDSLYGSRNLARKWASQNSLQVPGKKVIDTIDLFVLLDLLGQKGKMNIQNYFRNTAGRYQELQNIERELSRRNLLVGQCGGIAKNNFFKAGGVNPVGIEDDHLPFLRRGVKIVHLIPYPFPSVWHTRNDNLAAIDLEVIDNFSRIMNVFVADYFKLTTLPEANRK